MLAFFSIDQTRLSSALALAQSVASQYIPMPILANVLLRATSDGRVVCSATDTLVSLTETIPADVHTPGSLTLGVKPLHASIKTLPSGELRFRGLDGNCVQIAAGKSQFKFMGLPGSDFPELPDPERGAKNSKPVTFTTITGHALSDLIQKTGFSVSTDEARINLNGVLLESDGSTATMVSTDGHRLTTYTRPMEGLVLDKGIIIPRKGMLELRRVLDRYPGEVELGIGDQCLFLRAGELMLSVKLNNVAFPPYKQVIPAAHKREVRVGRDELLGALRRTEVMAADRKALVRMRLSDDTLAVTIDSHLGIAHHELAVTLRGDPLEISFNARFLMAALEVIDSENVCLLLQDELDAGVIKSEDASFIAVVMPVRMSEVEAQNHGK
jgi:DNA polymerase-3 subunit beta